LSSALQKKQCRHCATGRRRIVCCKITLGDDAFFPGRTRHLELFIMMQANAPDRSQVMEDQQPLDMNLTGCK
jgi:hypothetical protein